MQHFADDFLGCFVLTRYIDSISELVIFLNGVAALEPLIKVVILDLDQLLWHLPPQQHHQNFAEGGQDENPMSQLSSMHSGKMFDHNVVLSSLVNLCRSGRQTVMTDDDQPAAPPLRRHAIVAFSQDDIERSALERCRALHFRMQGVPTSFTLQCTQLPLASPRVASVARVSSGGQGNFAVGNVP